jgi:hypothetical protein
MRAPSKKFKVVAKTILPLKAHFGPRCERPSPLHSLEGYKEHYHNSAFQMAVSKCLTCAALNPHRLCALKMNIPEAPKRSRSFPRFARFTHLWIARGVALSPGNSFHASVET